MFTLTTALDFISQLEDEKIPLDVCSFNTEASAVKLMNVKKINKDSASPTTVHFAELISSLVKNRLKIPVSLKVFIDKNTPNVAGLKYEAKLYQYITDNIIKPKHSPNFIPFVAFGCCKADLTELKAKQDIIVNKLKMLTQSVLERMRAENFSPKEITTVARFNDWLNGLDQFDREKRFVVQAKIVNLREIFSELDWDDSSSILLELKNITQLFEDANTSKCFLITEQAGNGSQFGLISPVKSTASRLTGMYPVQPLDDMYEHFSNRDKYAVLFQIVYSLAVLEYFSINHNDLHVWNVLVVDFKQNLTLKFVMKNKTFIIPTRYVPYLFDWDQGFTPDLGDNPYVKALSTRTIMSNVYDSRRDLYILLCLLGSTGDERNQQIKPLEVYTKHPVMVYQREQIPIRLNKNEYDSIDRIYPYGAFTNDEERRVNLYKLSRAEVEEIIGPNKIPADLNTVYFYIVKIEEDDEETVYELYLWQPHYCRPTGMSSTFPTPLEMLNGGYFDRFLEKEKHKKETSIQTKEFVYTFPELGIN